MLHVTKSVSDVIRLKLKQNVILRIPVCPIHLLNAVEHRTCKRQFSCNCLEELKFANYLHSYWNPKCGK